MIMLQVGEVGELSEIFQWRGDTVANGLVGFSSDDKRHVGEEMSDVSPFLPCISAGYPIVEDMCYLQPYVCCLQPYVHYNC